MSGHRADDHTDHKTLPLYQAARVKQTESASGRYPQVAGTGRSKSAPPRAPTAPSRPVAAA